MQEVPRGSMLEKSDLLLAVYHENWERKEENHSLQQAKEKLKEIYQNCHMVTNDVYEYSGVQFKEYLIDSFYMLLKNYINNAIVNSYQDSNTDDNEIEFKEEDKEARTIVLAHQLYQSNENSTCTRLGQVGTACKYLFILAWGVGLLLHVIDQAMKDSLMASPGRLAEIGDPLIAAGCIGFCLFNCCAGGAMYYRNRDQNQARFFETARNRFFQIRRERMNGIGENEAKPSNNLAEPLLTPEEQAEYEEDEEPNVRLAS